MSRLLLVVFYDNNILPKEPAFVTSLILPLLLILSLMRMGDYDDTLAATRAALDGTVWNAAWNLGRSQPLPEVIAYALAFDRE
jgi:hypothetical protein